MTEILVKGNLIIVSVIPVILAYFVLPGIAGKDRQMRFPPKTDEGVMPKSVSWYIEGRTSTGRVISCSFVEFNERGDFLDLRQHQDCEARIASIVGSGPVLLVIYCHGWRNNSQSEDVVKFNAFLDKIATAPNVANYGFRVHGVYLSWRGTVVRPYVDKSDSDGFYPASLANFGEPIVDAKYNRSADWTGFVRESLNFFTRQRVVERLVTGLPMARAIFTYASTAKDYGKKPNNRVSVMGHSMGALMLELSLGHAMTGSLVMASRKETKNEEAAQKSSIPFDFILFLNSTAPSIYAKEMRDFLEANRSARRDTGIPDAPIIISLTSTADKATGSVYPMAHMLAPLNPSAQHRYRTGIFGSEGQTHPGIRQSIFYTRTSGHQRYLINHWLVREKADPMTNATPAEVFNTNISQKNVRDPYVFYTSSPRAAWRITDHTHDPVTLNGLPLSMRDTEYWIMNCGKDLIANHYDVWTTTAMEMYAGLYRLAARLKKPPLKKGISAKSTPI